MANVPPPNRNSKQARLPIAPPAPAEAPQNMATPNGDQLVNMGFKVKPAMQYRFKMEAARRSMTMVDLLEASFRAYLDAHPFEGKDDSF